MNSKWTIMALLFSVTINIAVVGTLVYFWKHNDERRVDVEFFHTNDKDDPKIVWFGRPPAPPPTGSEIDSLRRHYHEQLVDLRQRIDADRQDIIAQLMIEPVNRDTVEFLLKGLTDKQMDAERLTIDHLLQIKPLLPHDEWTFFIQDLRPRHTIRTKVIKLKDGDSTSILIDEKEFKELEIQDGKVIQFKHKN